MTDCEKQYIDVAKTSPKITLKKGCAEKVATISKRSKLGEVHGRTVNIQRRATRAAVPLKMPARYGVLWICPPTCRSLTTYVWTSEFAPISHPRTIQDDRYSGSADNMTIAIQIINYN